MFFRSAARVFRPSTAGISARTFFSSARAAAVPAFSRSTVAALTAGTAASAIIAYGTYASPVQLEGARTIAGEAKTVSERSYVMIKPDGTSRQLVGKIIDRFESRGYKLVALKSVVPSEELAKAHYADLAGRPFYPGLVKYITSGTPVIAMVWEGKDVIRQGRRMVGATNPLEAEPGSVRGQYCISVGANVIHASDSHDSATKEIALWFDEKELASDYTPVSWSWVMSDN